MKISKLLNKKYLSIFIFFFIFFSTKINSTEPVDIWNVDPNKVEADNKLDDTDSEEKIDVATVSQIKEWLEEGHFGIGSMEPKIKSALYFLKHHGNKVVITSIKKLEQAIAGKAGTQIIKD